MRSAFSCVVVLAAVAAVACGGAGPSAHGPVVVSVLRSDGFLVPFAAFDDGAWRAADPESIADRPAAWFADRGDVAGDWRLVTPLGLADLKGDPLPVRAKGAAVEVASHCQRVWALATDFPGSPTEPHDVHSVVGAAFAGSATPRQVAALDLTLPDTARVLDFLQPMFDAAEWNLVRERGETVDVTRRGDRAAKTPLAFTQLFYVTTRGETTTYGFEANRTYARASRDADYSCDDATVMTGWLAEGPFGGLALVRSDTILTDCDRKGGTRVQPLGTLEIGGRHFVLAIEYGYEDETYAIHEVLTDAVSPVLRVSAGGC